ncbi:hypothetical protein D187_005398 [Cystobacter fuscus DSM 2262]|uniref:Uncharacterized protein n=1 Tax=Cystobacter fuscus (strain ATCC 25194 / DSM 2262 / NBRC 100088 / M29) TaxID=1242864 RepID=S9QSJ1_CYSF2|nr:hypothetical protein D187_005398 [Cystobacter fuscus DSM 2262]
MRRQGSAGRGSLDKDFSGLKTLTPSKPSIPNDIGSRFGSTYTACAAPRLLSPGTGLRLSPPPFPLETVTRPGNGRGAHGLIQTPEG